MITREVYKSYQNDLIEELKRLNVNNREIYKNIVRKVMPDNSYYIVLPTLSKSNKQELRIFNDPTLIRDKDTRSLLFPKNVLVTANVIGIKHEFCSCFCEFEVGTEKEFFGNYSGWVPIVQVLLCVASSSIKNIKMPSITLGLLENYYGRE